MSRNNVKLVVSWKNCFIWGGIMTIVSLCVRILLWVLMIRMSFVDYISSEVINLNLPLLAIPAFFVLAIYVSMYRKFAVLAAKYPANRKDVAKGVYGKPVIFRTVILVVLGLLWMVVSAITMMLSGGLIFSDYVERQMFWTFLQIQGIGLALDVVLLQLGNFFFKPNEIQNA